MLDATVSWILGAIAVTMVLTFLAGRRWRSVVAPTILRVLGVAGLVAPAATIIDWYEQLSRARALAGSLPVDPTPIAERFLINAAMLLFLGFALLISGIYLARRLQPSPPE